MRVFLGVTVLLSLFLMASFWQKGITNRLEQQREHEQGISIIGKAGEDRWVSLVLGRPSGAEPMPSPIHLQGSSGGPPANAPLPSPGPESWPPADPQPDIEPDVQYIVRSGDILGTICTERYGTSKPRVLEAVAQYNELENLDALKEGQTLALPSLEILFPGGQD